MEKKYYIIPTIKVKEMEAETLLDGSIEVVDDPTDPIDDPTDIEAKPMYGDFNVWDK
ncbi:MAG: hypothetical protein IKW98_01750 [Prevotella sp.]|nr:hypothetical protein [Prevotella sp.]